MNLLCYVYKNRICYHDEYFRTKHTKEDKLEKANLSDSDNSSFYDYLNKEDLYLSDVDEPGKSDNLASDKTDFKVNEEQNVSYELFTIGPTESPQHERIKHGVKEYQMLVRVKTDGIEVRIFLYCFLILILINNQY